MSSPIITVENVSKAVAGRSLLSGVSFSVDAGSLVSLIGPNGAGKSTLVNIILGFDTQYTGTVTVRAGERVQYIPQLSVVDTYQLPMSVYEYLAIGAAPLYRRDRSPVDYVAVLEHVGIAPEVLHQRYSGLSGGERQRVAIARSLLEKPTVLVLDEPLAAVDYASRAGLYALLRHLQQDHAMTVLLVSHDIESVLSLSDRVLCLNRTLHTDCHPTALDADAAKQFTTIHHHC